jgi:hypothetical protein
MEWPHEQSQPRELNAVSMMMIMMMMSMIMMMIGMMMMMMMRRKRRKIIMDHEERGMHDERDGSWGMHACLSIHLSICGYALYLLFSGCTSR